MAKATSRIRKVLYFIGLLIFAGLMAYALGPRPVADTTIEFEANSLPDDLDAYIAASEARFDDLRPGNEKQIVWAYPASRARTPIAIVYIHGFSASPGELRPLPDIVAKNLGANLYYARLTGHGRSGDAMLEGSVHNWVNDFAEAMAIGRRLGERVVVMATSTGASLSTWSATRPELMQNVIGMVQFSANYGLQATGSSLLTKPWAEKAVLLTIGERRSFEVKTEAQARLWTHEYPSLSLLQMALLIDLAKDADPRTITVPSLFIHSPLDKIIQPEAIRQKAASWGAPTKIIEVLDDEDAPSHHVIAGDAISPSTTARLAAQTTEWIAGL